MKIKWFAPGEAPDRNLHDDCVRVGVFSDSKSTLIKQHAEAQTHVRD